MSQIQCKIGPLFIQLFANKSKNVRQLLNHTFDKIVNPKKEHVSPNALNFLKIGTSALQHHVSPYPHPHRAFLREISFSDNNVGRNNLSSYGVINIYRNV